MKITTTKQNVTDETGKVIRSMYYLHIKTEKAKTPQELVVNVGEKTWKSVQDLNKAEEAVTPELPLK